jgi:hypothetical protein
MSVTHEYGYFTVVGRHFQTLLTTTDYFANSILWLPYVVWMIWSWGEWSKLRAPLPKKRNWKNWREWIWPIFIALFSVATAGVDLATWFFSRVDDHGSDGVRLGSGLGKVLSTLVWLGEDLRPIVRNWFLQVRQFYLSSSLGSRECCLRPRTLRRYLHHSAEEQ